MGKNRLDSVNTYESEWFHEDNSFPSIYHKENAETLKTDVAIEQYMPITQLTVI